MYSLQVTTNTVDLLNSLSVWPDQVLEERAANASRYIIIVSMEFYHFCHTKCSVVNDFEGIALNLVQQPNFTNISTNMDRVILEAVSVCNPFIFCIQINNRYIPI